MSKQQNPKPSPLTDVVDKIVRELSRLAYLIIRGPITEFDDSTKEEEVFTELEKISEAAADLCVTAEHITKKHQFFRTASRREHTQLLTLLKESMVKTLVQNLNNELGLFIIRNVNEGLVSEEFIRIELHKRIMWLQGMLTNLEAQLPDEGKANG